MDRELQQGAPVYFIDTYNFHMHLSSLSPLSIRQVRLLEVTFKSLDADEFATLFYQKLFWQHPLLRPLFPVDLKDQKEKLMSVLELIVHSFDEKTSGNFTLHNSLIVPLRNLGITHEEKGIIPAHYPIANGLMLEIFTLTLGELYTDEIRDAWSLALQHVTAAMLDQSIRVESAETRDAFQQGFALIRKYFSKVV